MELTAGDERGCALGGFDLNIELVARAGGHVHKDMALSITTGDLQHMGRHVVRIDPGGNAYWSGSGRFIDAAPFVLQEASSQAAQGSLATGRTDELGRSARFAMAFVPYLCSTLPYRVHRLLGMAIFSVKAVIRLEHRSLRRGRYCRAHMRTD